MGERCLPGAQFNKNVIGLGAFLCNYYPPFSPLFAKYHAALLLELERSLHTQAQIRWKMFTKLGLD